MQAQAGMLLWVIPGLVSIALFVATLRMSPLRARATVLPPAPREA